VLAVEYTQLSQLKVKYTISGVHGFDLECHAYMYY
jgi:hypothetical protein